MSARRALCCQRPDRRTRYHWVDTIGRPGLGIELAVDELTLLGEYDTLTFPLTTLLPRG